MKILLSIVLLILLSIAPIVLPGNNTDPAIIFADINLADTLIMNRIEVQRIFTRKEVRWNNGDDIIVFIKPMDSIEHRAFLANVLNMTLYKYQKSLDAVVYTAKALPVIEVSNDDKMRMAIHSHPGAIGYINYELIMNEKTVKVVD